jgi:hypothetical protein
MWCQQTAVNLLTHGLSRYNIHKEFGLKNCANFPREKEKLIHYKNLIILVRREIQQLEFGERYMYPGMEEVKAYYRKK